jgi:hypothetical protein
MQVTAERMDILGRKLNLPIQAQVEDLVTSEGKAAGTRVTLQLPLETESSTSPNPS